VEEEVSRQVGEEQHLYSLPLGARGEAPPHAHEAPQDLSAEHGTGHQDQRFRQCGHCQSGISKINIIYVINNLITPLFIEK
jgi:hypothetical protein